MSGDYESRRQERRERWEQKMEQWRQRRERDGGRSHVWTGVFILLIGVAALINVSNPELPSWLFSWKTFLIALGLFIGLKHGFRGPAWFILIVVGGAFLVGDIYPDISIRQYIFPGVLILVGGLLIIKSRNRSYSQDPEKKNAVHADQSGSAIIDSTHDSKEDYVDSTSIFGGAKKNIISKNFKGGDLVNIFGGTELDLTRADFTGTAVVELTTIFGGTKFIVPSNWTVKSEAVTIFGGMEDKRSSQTLTDNPEKVLILRGTVIFGGIEIKSF